MREAGYCGVWSGSSRPPSKTSGSRSPRGSVAVVAVRVWNAATVTVWGLSPALSRGYDAGEGAAAGARWTWARCVPSFEADAPRVHCPEHGVVVAHVPWARTALVTPAAFDQQVAWLAVQRSKTAVTAVDADRVAHGRGDRWPGSGADSRAAG